MSYIANTLRSIHAMKLKTEPLAKFGVLTQLCTVPPRPQAGGGAGPTMNIGPLWRRRRRRPTH